MKRNWTALALFALLLAPALACQTITGAFGLGPSATATLPPVPTLSATSEIEATSALPELEITLPVLPTIEFGEEAPEDIPIMDSAENPFTTETLISYDTPQTFDEVLAFYKDEMPANGWEQVDDGFTFGESAIINFTKDNRTAVVTITGGEDKSSVLVAIGEESP